MLELLLVAVLSMSLVAAVASQVSGETGAIRAKADDYREISRVEGILRTLEAARTGQAKCGPGMWGDGTDWRVESGLIRISYGGRIIEARGVFCDDDAEPL